MESCRISWGRVEKVDGPSITISTEPLVYSEGKLLIGAPAIKKVVRNLESDFDIEQLKIGDIITTHWGVPCEIITAAQALTLKKYTLKHLKLANQTI